MLMALNPWSSKSLLVIPASLIWDALGLDSPGATIGLAQPGFGRGSTMGWPLLLGSKISWASNVTPSEDCF